VLHPQGVAVVVEGAHMCSMMRGVKKPNATMTTSTMLGAFRDDPKTRSEFMSHISRRHFDE
jgi:GTP cyclohydrolase I